MTWTNPAALPRIGISSCLLGENVRYDGGNKKDVYITEQLPQRFEFVPFCPEVAIGMGIPRPPMHLVEQHGETRALGIENPAMDMTVPLREYAAHIAADIAGLSGYIFKRNSPSCGISEVRLLVAGDRYEPRGRGVFAAEIMQRFPHLPVIDEQQLKDQALRRLFFADVMRYFGSRATHPPDTT